MRHYGETATERAAEYSSLKRFVTATRRLLTDDPCERCRTAPATVANGAGRGWCQVCANAIQVERRAAIEQRDELRRQLDIAKEWP